MNYHKANIIWTTYIFGYYRQHSEYRPCENGVQHWGWSDLYDNNHIKIACGIPCGYGKLLFYTDKDKTFLDKIKRLFI